MLQVFSLLGVENDASEGPRGHRWSLHARGSEVGAAVPAGVGVPREHVGSEVGASGPMCMRSSKCGRTDRRRRPDVRALSTPLILGQRE